MPNILASHVQAAGYNGIVADRDGAAVVGVLSFTTTLSVAVDPRRHGVSLPMT
jgi:hypothetical protein